MRPNSKICRLTRLITEFGPSQFEINLYHQDSAVRACDQGSMLKRAIRSVARQHEKVASFMAKPFAEQVGNGMHIHFSRIRSARKQCV